MSEDFQRSSSHQGRTYEEAVAAHLERFGWAIKERGWVEPNTGVEVDIVAVDRDGEEWWIECKGSWQSKSDRNGMKRHDTARKAICSAALLSLIDGHKPYLIVTSDLPEGTVARWVNMALEQGWIARIEALKVI